MSFVYFFHAIFFIQLLLVLNSFSFVIWWDLIIE